MKKVFAILLVMAVAVVGLFAANDGATVNLIYNIEAETGFRVVAAGGASTVNSYATAKAVSDDDLGDVTISVAGQAIKDVVAYSNKSTGSYTIKIKGSAFQLGNSDSASASRRFGYVILKDGETLLQVAPDKTVAAPSDAVKLFVLNGGNGQAFEKATLSCDIANDASNKESGNYTAVLTFNIVTV